MRHLVACLVVAGSIASAAPAPNKSTKQPAKHHVKHAAEDERASGQARTGRDGARIAHETWATQHDEADTHAKTATPRAQSTMAEDIFADDGDLPARTPEAVRAHPLGSNHHADVEALPGDETSASSAPHKRSCSPRAKARARGRRC